MMPKSCIWVKDEEGNWDTGCDNKHILLNGTPSENHMWFCCYCGLPLVEEAVKEDPC